MRISHFFLALLAGLACFTQAFPSTFDDKAQVEEPTFEQEAAEPVNVELIAEDSAIRAGQPFWVAIHFKTDDGWHLYWKNPGDAGAPPQLDWNLPEGFSAGPILWPVPTRFEVSGFSGLGYEESFTLLTQITPPKEINDKDVTIEADVQWVACRNECVPGMPTVSLTLPISNQAPIKNASANSVFLEARGALPSTEMQAIAEYEGGGLVLHFNLPNENIEQAVFYPEQQGLINLGAPQILTSVNGVSHLQLALSDPDQELNGQEVSGVLILSDKDGKKYTAELKATSSIESKNQVIKASSHTFADGKPQLLQTAEFSSTSSESEGMDEGGMGIGFAILAAFAGGLLLNLMPCVLPVLSLKVLSVVQAAGDSKIERYKQGFAYVLGVLLSFWVLAGLLLILRASGEEIGWGFQLQEPIFVGILACMLFLMALNLFGVFEWGTSFAAIGGSKAKKSGVAEALWSGVLATIIATPCTGPFLGASLGFAMALPPLGSFALFTVMGLGMAIPFLLLTISPPLLRLLPKPGQWMVTLKEGMGFLLVASVLWLIWVWEAQTDFMSVMVLLGALIVLSFGAWVYGNWGQLTNTFKSRMIAMSVAACTLILAITVIVQAANQESTLSPGGDKQLAHLTSTKNPLNVDWENFSPERLQELTDKGVPVFIDFTAKWCLLCQANKVVLHSSSVVENFEQIGAVKMRADWTKKDPVITRFLKSYKRSGVPLYVLYKPGQSPQLFPETLTADMILEATQGLKK